MLLDGDIGAFKLRVPKFVKKGLPYAGGFMVGGPMGAGAVAAFKKRKAIGKAFGKAGKAGLSVAGRGLSKVMPGGGGGGAAAAPCGFFARLFGRCS